MLFKTVSTDLQEVSNDSLNVILDTIVNGNYPGSQLYLYFRLHTPWEEALDPRNFIDDTAYIFNHQLPLDENTVKLLSKYYIEETHHHNIYRILTEAWKKLD